MQIKSIEEKYKFAELFAVKIDPLADNILIVYPYMLK